MSDRTSRRSFVHATGLAAFGLAVTARAQSGPADKANPPGVPPDWLPMQDPAMVKEMVTVSHFDAKRVRELVEQHPSLSIAAVDWGFGDWEDALGAASHTGNRPIAEILLAHR